MKRQISFVAALVMLITTIFSGTAFAAFSDVADDNRYRNAIITLSKLSVIDGYDDGTFKPEGQITRAEFTKMLMATMGFGDNQTKATEFDDAMDHWANTYIKTAYDMGIINGTGERTFEPDNPVTYEQALKMVVCALGYEATAQANGGYPSGYITAANNLSLGGNIVSQANSAPAARQVIAQVIYNSLEVEMLEKNAVGAWTKADKNLLEDYLKVVKLKGTLTGVEDTKTNDCDVNLIRNQIAVRPAAGSPTRETVVINLGDYKDHSIGEIAKMIGNEITFYYHQGDDDSDKDLKIIDAETTNNNIITIENKRFAGYSGNSFKYTDGPSQKTLRVKSGVTIIYNGQAVSNGDLPLDIAARYGEETKTAETADELLALWLGSDDNYNIRGEVTFTDTGADGNIDIVSINDYKTILAYKAPTTSDYRLQDSLKTGNFIDLNPENIDKKIYVEKDGKEIAPTAIKAKDVVSYTESLDESIINAYVASKTVTGSVSSIDSTGNTITINGEEYDLGEGCLSYIEEKEGRALATGVSGTFYLDKLGAVVYGKLTTVTANPYGYIANVVEDNAEDAAYVLLYLPSVDSRSVGTYQISDKVKINGTQMKSYADAMKELESIAASTNPDADAKGVYNNGAAPENIDFSQPVRVRVSGKTVTEIYTVDTKTNEQNEDPTKLSCYRPLKNYYYTGSSFKEKSSSSVLFTVNSNTTVLYVPRDRSDKGGYSKKTISNAFTSGQTFWVEAYDVNKSNVASLVILYGDTGKLNEIKDTTDYSIVAKAPEESYDEQDDTTTSLISVYAGATTSTTSWQAANASEFEDLEPGDVIQFAYDDDKKIQGRKDIIRFADVRDILDGAETRVTYTNGEEEETRTEMYNWNQENASQTADNDYQRYMFDYRYPKSNAGNLSGSALRDNYYVEYTSSQLGVVPKSRVAIYNVYQLVEDSNGNINKMFLTKEGFQDGELRSDGVIEYDEVTVSSSTRMIRMENASNGITFSPYAVDTTENLTARDLKDAMHYGDSCSKVMVCSRYGGAVLITVLPEN